MELENLTVAVDDGLAIVTLTRPDRGNALDAQAGRDLRSAALRCSTDPAIRAVLLRSEGKAFCVGGDIKDFKDQSDLPSAVKDMTVDFHAAQAMFARMAAPIICAVHGAAAGAGVSLVAVSDYVIAGRSATFTYAYAGVGFTADGGLTWLLPRLMGLRRFQSFVLTGETLSAEKALEDGIVSRIENDEDVADAAFAFARRIATGPSRAYAGIKRLTASGGSHGLEQHLEDEAQALVVAARTSDAGSAIASVANRQRPVFTGN